MRQDEETYRYLVTKRFNKELNERIARMSDEDLKRAIEFEKRKAAEDVA